MLRITKRSPKSQTLRKVHLGLVTPQQTLPIKTEITNPTETSPAETFKGVIIKEGIPLETSLVKTFKEETYRERTPLGNTRGTPNQEIIKTLITKETINIETIIENNHHGEIKVRTNPHGMYKVKEIQENNPPGEAREVVTQ